MKFWLSEWNFYFRRMLDLCLHPFPLPLQKNNENVALFLYAFFTLCGCLVSVCISLSRGPTGKNQVGLSPKSGTPLANFPQAEMCRGYLKEPSHDGVAGQQFRILIPLVSFPYLKWVNNWSDTPTPGTVNRWVTLYTRGLQRDVIYLGWPIASSYMSPNAGGGGEVAGSQPISTAVHRIPNKQRRSNSILPMLYTYSTSWGGTSKVCVRMSIFS